MTIRNLGWIVVAACLATAGCGPKDQITAYTVPKEHVPKERAAAPAPQAPPVAATATSDRMLAAVLPDGDRGIL